MRSSNSGYAHGTTGSPQTSIEQEEYSLKVAENEATLKEFALSTKPSFLQVDINTQGKLIDYALNPNHSTGKHKARVFKSALDFTQDDAYKLEKQIREKVPYHKAIKGKKDKYGQRWTVCIPIEGNNNKKAIVETAWIVRAGSSTPELITAFVE